MPQEAGIRARPEEGFSTGERGSVCSCEAGGLKRGEPEGGWAMFPFPGRKKEKQPFP